MEKYAANDVLGGFLFIAILLYAIYKISDLLFGNKDCDPYD